MKTKFIAISTLLALAINSAHATPVEDIYRLGGCTANVMQQSRLELLYRQSLGGDSAAHEQYGTGVADIYRCIDDKLKPAIDASADHVDLRDAIKDFYVKSKSFVSAMNSGAKNQASRDKSASWTKVELEMKLAGIK